MSEYEYEAVMNKATCVQAVVRHQTEEVELIQPVHRTHRHKYGLETIDTVRRTHGALDIQSLHLLPVLGEE